MCYNRCVCVCFRETGFSTSGEFCRDTSESRQRFCLISFFLNSKENLPPLVFFFVFFFWTFEWSTFYYTTATNSSSTTSYSLYSSLLTGWVHTYYGHLITVYTTYVFLVLGGRCKWCMSLSFFTISFLFFFFFFFKKILPPAGGFTVQWLPKQMKNARVPFYTQQNNNLEQKRAEKNSQIGLAL